MNFSTVPYPENRRQSFLSAVVQWPINHLQTQLSTEDDDGPAEKPVTQVEPTTSRNQSLLLVVQNQLRICRQGNCSMTFDYTNCALYFKAILLVFMREVKLLACRIFVWSCPSYRWIDLYSSMVAWIQQQRIRCSIPGTWQVVSFGREKNSKLASKFPGSRPRHPPQ